MEYFDYHYRVIYADTDRMGVTYYGHYFLFFEAARNDVGHCCILYNIDASRQPPALPPRRRGHFGPGQLGRTALPSVLRRLMQPEPKPKCAFDRTEELVELLTVGRISGVRVLKALQLLARDNDYRGEHLVNDRGTGSVISPRRLASHASAAIQEVQG